MKMLLVKPFLSVWVMSGFFLAARSSVITFDQNNYNENIDEPVKEETGSHQSWNYVTVREKAHMFWWLYESEAEQGWSNVPIILWLQGGPGASGTGFGNFEEIGPLNVKLEKRNTTWLKYASLLFIDNPVGAGYSYADDKSAYCQDIDCIGKDLLTIVEHLMVNDLKKYQKTPFYIFSESYGGKMAAIFSQYLYTAMKEKNLPINFKGVALGDAWIAPAMNVESWAYYLLATSLVGKTGFDAVTEAAHHVTNAANNKDWTGATKLWADAETVVANYTSSVNFYNIMKWISDDAKLLSSRIENPSVRSLYERHMGVYAGSGLTALMNGFVKDQLKIIPDHVTWGGQMQDVFVAQSGEFMKPVIDAVYYLLQKTDLQVVVYNGQLDLVCDTLGVEGWVQILPWADLADFYKAPRLVMKDKSGKPRAFVREYKKLSFYWVLESGHMIPQDQGESSVMMLTKIIGTKP